MRYRDLKLGDVIIFERHRWLVIGVKKLENDWITIHFVHCLNGAMQIFACGYRPQSEVWTDEVIRGALQGSETG